MDADFGARQFALKRLVAAFDLGDELGDVILLLDRLRRNRPALLIEIAADETHPRQQLLRRIGGKIKHRILLANLCGDHGDMLVKNSFPPH